MFAFEFKSRSFSIATIFGGIKKLEFRHIAKMVFRDGFSIICNLFITYFLYEKFGFREVGLYALVRTYTATLESLLRMPTDSLLPRAYGRNNDLKETVNQYLNILVLSLFLLSFVTCLILLFKSLVFREFLGISNEICIYIYLTVLFRMIRSFFGYIAISLKNFNLFNKQIVYPNCCLLVSVLVFYLLDLVSIPAICIFLMLAELMSVFLMYPRVVSELRKYSFALNFDRLLGATALREIELYANQLLNFFSTQFINLLFAAISAEALGIFHALRSVSESVSRSLNAAFTAVYNRSIASAYWKDDKAKVSLLLGYVLVMNGLVFVLGAIFTFIVNYYSEFLLALVDLPAPIKLESSLVFLFGFISNAFLFVDVALAARASVSAVFRSSLVAFVMTLFSLIFIGAYSFPLEYWYCSIVGTIISVKFFFLFRRA